MIYKQLQFLVEDIRNKIKDWYYEFYFNYLYNYKLTKAI